MEGFNIQESLEKEAIEFLEDIDYVGPTHKAVILATYLGLKPMSVFSTQFIPGSSVEILSHDLEFMLENMGLKFSRGYEYEQNAQSNTHDPEYVSLFYYISKNEENLKSFSITPDIKKYHKEFGLALGFPKTAVDAFVNRDDLLNEDNLPDDFTEEDRKFRFFVFSKSGYKEELEWLRKIIEGVKEVSPKIYEQVMDRDIKQ